MTATRSPAFRLEQVSYWIDQTPILQDISGTIAAGQWVGILGPNGAGKSTLLRILAGVLPPSSGRVVFEDQPLQSWPVLERAQRLAFVPQRTELTFPFQVREVVAMGRTPYLRRWQTESQADERIVNAVMTQTETRHLADRDVLTLSGGELQRVTLARALAQQPQYLVLDEPTASLDLRHQFEVIEILEGLVSHGVTVLTAVHDLNLAARVCATLILLRDGQVYAIGTPQEVLTAEIIHAVYEVDVVLEHNTATATLQIIPVRGTGPRRSRGSNAV